MTILPSSSAGWITSETSSARAAANRSASVRASTRIAGSFSSSRTRSPTAVPPGSRTATARSPKRLAQEPRLGGLARAVDSLESHEEAGHESERSVGSGPMKALVTGGAGFIGSNLVDALVERGDDVTIVDDLSTGKRENLADGPGAAAELVEADIRDARAMRDLVDRTRPQVDLPPRRPDRRAEVHRGPGVGRRHQRGRHDQHAAGGARGGRGPLRQHLDRRARSTARAGSCRRPRTTRRRPRRRTGSRSSAPRATATSTRACTASRRSRCATATSTARARTRSARPA